MDNRNLLLNSALQLFAARGYDAVGIQEIVDTAGVTKPTLYHYFESKRGLLDALLENEFGSLLLQIKQAAIYSGDLPLTLELLMRAYFAAAQRRPDFFRLQLALYFAPPQSEPYGAVSRYHKEQLAVLEGVFNRAVIQNGNLRGKQRACAASFNGLVHTYVSLYLNGLTPLSDPLPIQVVHQFLHGILS